MDAAHDELRPGPQPVTRNPQPDTLDLIAALADKSLLQLADEGGAEPRFLMLETVREFAWERMEESGEVASLRDRHAAWCLAFAEPVEQELMGPNQAVWFARLDEELPNLRAALTWFLAQGEASTACVLPTPSTGSGHRAAISAKHATGSRRSWPCPRPRNHAYGALIAAANIRHWQGDIDQAIVYTEESLAICQAHDDHLFVMHALRKLGQIALDRGDLDRAASLLAESGALLPSAGNAWDPAFATHLAGWLAAAAGNEKEAFTRFAEAADAFRMIGDHGYVAAARGQQGAAATRLGDLPAAAAAYTESLELAIAARDQTWVAWALDGAAHVAHATGQPTTAARLLGGAAAIREAIGEGRLPKSALDNEVKSTLGEARFAAEWSHGTHWSETEVIAAARTVLGDDGFRPLTGDKPGLARESTLTPRELDVLRLLVAGQADKEIAATFGISRATVSRYVERSAPSSMPPPAAPPSPSPSATASPVPHT